MTDEDKDKASLRRVDDAVNVDDLDVAWPEFMPALANGGGGLVGDHALQIDGHGHLYVFPFVRETENPERPVDVYSSEGELLFTGFIPVPSWMDAVGDSIYRFEEDERTEELQVVRYRLVEPF